MQIRLRRQFHIAFILGGLIAPTIASADATKDLWDAANHGDESKVVKAIAAGGNVNVLRDRYTPLMLAAIGGRTAMGAALIKAGAAVNAVNDEHKSAVWFAGLRGHLDFIKLLIDHRAQLDIRAGSGSTALVEAVHGGHSGVVAFLIEKGVDLEVTTGTAAFRPLHFAARRGDRETVRLLLNKGAQVNAVTSHGETALAWSAVGGHVETSRLLLERGIDFRAVNADRKTVREVIGTSGHADITQLLAEAERAGVEAIRRNGVTDQPIVTVRGLDVWLNDPRRSVVAIERLSAVQTARGSGRDRTEEMSVEVLRDIVDRMIATKASGLAADAIVVRTALAATRTTTTTSSPGVKGAVIGGIIGGLTGIMVPTTSTTRKSTMEIQTVSIEAVRYRPALPSPTTAAARDDIAAWTAAETALSPSAFQDYLDRRPAGHFSAAARARLEQFEALETRRRTPAIVYLWRAKGEPGKPSAFVDGVEVARLLGGRYIRLALPEGEKKLAIDSKDAVPFAIDIVGGETYYLRSKWGFKRGDYAELLAEIDARPELAAARALEAEWLRDRALLTPDQSLPWK
jgi:ankyrin repeat protein